MKIVDFRSLNGRQHDKAVDILKRALFHIPSAFHGPGEATAHVAKLLADEDWNGLAALEADELRGWIGGLKQYSHAWELHPLVVDPDFQRRGIGTQLVDALEQRARTAGVLTLYLSSDDDYGGTNLSDVDLYPGLPDRIRGIAAASGHAFTFYRRCGYAVVGVIPDANGRGKPDIFMAKRIF